MRIIVTGNMGYLGPVLAEFLRTDLPGCALIGFDSGFFSHCLTDVVSSPETLFCHQYNGDIRSLPQDVLRGADAVVHLAAVSNDSMGNRFETVTEEINQAATLRLAELSREAGVKSFVFASSCSIYGYSEGDPRKETDPIHPLTTYAQTKIETERAMASTDLGNMVVTSLRFPTACGMSGRLRLDLVLNDFVACAVTMGEISVLSDGTPWRPLIDVEDMARAIAWAIRRPSDSRPFLAVNVGRDECNYQVRDLAQATAAAIPGTRVKLNAAAPPDKRSYKIDFSLFKTLAPDHLPQITLLQSIERMRDGLLAINFSDKNFRHSNYIRLKVLEDHIAAGRLNNDLRWVDPGMSLEKVQNEISSHRSCRSLPYPVG